MGKWHSRLVIILLGLIISGVVLEVAARLVTTTNVDGTRFLMALPLPPYAYPVRSTQATVERYLTSDESIMIYDSHIGWRNRPSANENNAAGLRAEREYDLTPPADVLRIAVFGDSFTYGYEVALQDSWAYQLEQTLNARGVNAEVLNFGVGGYGIDQAYWMWSQSGRSYQPDVVILGFFEFDVLRMLSLHWTHLTFQNDLTAGGAGLNPFSKPRFLLADDDLTVVNQPTVPPEEIPAFIAGFDQSPLAAYDNLYDPSLYANRWWRNSVVLAAAETVTGKLSLQPGNSPQVIYDANAQNLFTPDHEGYQLTLAVLDRWQREATAEGSQFLVVDLPREEAVRAHRTDAPPVYAPLWTAISANYPTLETLPLFTDDNIDAYFESGEHYSPSGNQVIASALAHYFTP